MLSLTAGIRQAAALLPPLFMLLFLGGWQAVGQDDNLSPSMEAPSHLQGPTDPKELEGFLDAFFAEIMHDMHVPGAAITVVKDGKVFLRKGYGYADLAHETAVDPERTLFRAGSIAKMFTVATVMQLVDQGKIDLDADINRYLKRFKIAYKYDKPITMAMLLTHTHGLDIPYIGMFTRDASALPVLGDYLSEDIPVQVEPPGASYLYSNVGMTLAGLIVEEVTGLSFDSYVQRNILQPLGMRRTTFQQPLPDSLADDLAVGYTYDGVSYSPLPFTYVKPVPAGALTTTAADMAPFMIALLQDGRYGDVRLFSEQAGREMKRRQFAHHPAMPGTSYGLYEVFRNNHRTLQHGGIVPGYVNLISLAPDEGFGFFAAGNQVGDDVEVFERLATALADNYYASPAPGKNIRLLNATPDAPLSAAQLRRFRGVYRDEQYPRGSLVKLGLFMGWRAEIHVDANSDGTLTLYPAETRWVPVEPLLFRSADDADHLLAFQEDENGRITHLVTDEGIMRYTRLPWYEKMSLHWRLLRAFQLTFLASPLVWLFGYVFVRFRRRQHARRAPDPGYPAKAVSDDVRLKNNTRLAKPLASLVCILNIGFLLGIIAVFVKVDAWALPYGMPQEGQLLLLLPLVSTLLTLFLPLYTVRAWITGSWSLPGRLYYMTVTGIALLFIPFLLYWNLLKFPV